MLQITFTELEQDTLFKEFRSDTSGNLRLRYLALYLKSLELPHNIIMDICRISGPTLCTYLKLWQQGGKEKLADVQFVRHASKLAVFSDVIKTHFENNPVQTSNEAREKIKEITGIERCPTQIRTFMKSIGLRIRKVGFVPGKASTPEKQLEQEEFKKNSTTFVRRGKIS